MTLCVPSTVYCTLQSEHTIVVKKKENKGVHCKKLAESTSISITESQYKDTRKHEHTDDKPSFPKRRDAGMGALLNYQKIAIQWQTSQWQRTADLLVMKTSIAAMG